MRRRPREWALWCLCGNLSGGKKRLTHRVAAAHDHAARRPVAVEDVQHRLRQNIKPVGAWVAHRQRKLVIHNTTKFFTSVKIWQKWRGARGNAGAASQGRVSDAMGKGGRKWVRLPAARTKTIVRRTDGPRQWQPEKSLRSRAMDVRGLWKRHEAAAAAAAAAAPPPAAWAPGVKPLPSDALAVAVHILDNRSPWAPAPTVVWLTAALPDEVLEPATYQLTEARIAAAVRSLFCHASLFAFVSVPTREQHLTLRARAAARRWRRSRDTQNRTTLAPAIAVAAEAS